MTRRFLMKEIARQAGVSLATVDRVLNRRPGVRLQTVKRVEGALAELEVQSSELVMSGRTLVLDLVMEAPQYFVDALGEAIAIELPALHAPAFRIRIDARSHYPEDQMCNRLFRVSRRDSDGVILMGPDVPALASAVDRLAEAGIPVVTLASDVSGSRRHAYVGLDNRQAGATAAWLLRQWLGRDRPRFLVTIRNRQFSSEVERYAGFSAAVRSLFAAPETRLLTESDDGQGIGHLVEMEIRDHEAPAAIYSIGGGNHAITGVIARLGVNRPVFVGHDVNDENIRLLRTGKIDLVIHHDFREDIRKACAAFANFHSNGAIRVPATAAPLRILVPPMLTGEETGGA